MSEPTQMKLPRRIRYIIFWALLCSLLLHGLLLGGFSFSLHRKAPVQSSLQVRLIALPVPPASPYFPVKKPKLTPRRHVVAPRHLKPLKAHAAELPNPVPPILIPKQGSTAVTDTPSSSIPSQSSATDSPPQTATPVAAPLPHIAVPVHFELQYHISLGEHGLSLGHASYVWLAESDRYTLVSITQAEGLLALFQTGRLEQISSGHVTIAGLVPDDFTIQRGNDSTEKSTQIHIDYKQQQATVTHGGQNITEPIPAQVQDILSVIFQLALHPPAEQNMPIYVSSGKEFKLYNVQIVGHETIHTPLGTVQALHLSLPAEGDDTMDIWLDTDHNNVPVKVRVHQNGVGTIVQVITGMQSFEK